MVSSPPPGADDSFDAVADELISFVRGIKRFYRRLPHDGEVRLEPPSFVLLGALVDSEAARPSTLAERVCLDLSTVSRQLAALEAQGWAARQRDPADGRAVLFVVTGEGRAVLEQAVARRRAMVRDAVTGWTQGERVEFARLLARLNNELHPAEPLPVN